MIRGAARAIISAFRGAVPSVPTSPVNVFLSPGNQWYEPAVAGASTFGGAIASAATTRRALAVLETLSPDAYANYVIEFYRTGLARFGNAWRYADMNTAVIALAAVLHPSSYLEIGVRRGRSLAMVASEAPSCTFVACDLFLENYAGMDNPGADFVRSELERAGFRGAVEFVIGDSRRVLPAYFRRSPGQFFDMITVDGDHSEQGARADLTLVKPRVKIGGALVFDDISNPAHVELRQVWEDVIGVDPSFSTFVFDEVGFGIAVAIRMR